MDTVVELLFWIHLGSLGLGGAAVFGIPIVGSRIAGAPPETRPTLFAVADGLSMLGRAAIGLLIVTGPLLVWLKFGGDVAALGTWFWVKMALVVILLVIIVVAGINAKRAQAGDMASARRAPQLSIAAIVVYLLVIGAAVVTFG